MTSTVGLLLAAGAGRRMGGPKALLRPTLGAPTRVESAIGDLLGAGLTRVLVVLGAGAEDAAPLARAVGAEVVVAGDWQEGMGASLRAGLRWLADAAPGDRPPGAALVTLVDLPDVGAPVHRRVLEAHGDRPDRLARAAYDGRAGHPVALGRDHWAAVMEGAVGDRGARLHLTSHAVLLVECGDLATGRDVDSPADLHGG